MCRASFHTMGTLNTLSSLFIAPHYSRDDALGLVYPTSVPYGVTVDPRPRGGLSHPGDMGGQAPSSEPSFGALYMLIYHQETHETSVCAPKPLCGPT